MNLESGSVFSLRHQTCVESIRILTLARKGLAQTRTDDLVRCSNFGCNDNCAICNDMTAHFATRSKPMSSIFGFTLSTIMFQPRSSALS